MYHKTVITKTLERKRRKCAAMRAAKELKRLAMDPGSVEVGVIIELIAGLGIELREKHNLERLLG